MRLDFLHRGQRQAKDTASSAARTVAHFELGRRGEDLAIAELEQSGYRIVAANFTVPIGRNIRDVMVDAEIDIVAYDGPILCFVEVKSRASNEFAAPHVNVDLRKQRQVARAARAYRRMFGLLNQPYRYDVVTVVTPARDATRAQPQVELLKNFWTDEKLRKRTWQKARWD